MVLKQKPTCNCFGNVDLLLWKWTASVRYLWLGGYRPACVKDLLILWTHFQAATEVIEAKTEVLVTFPPKAPPTLLTWQVTLLDAMFNVSATASCTERSNPPAALTCLLCSTCEHWWAITHWVTLRFTDTHLLRLPELKLATEWRCKRWTPSPRRREPPACSASPCRNAPGLQFESPLRRKHAEFKKKKQTLFSNNFYLHKPCRQF